MPMPMAMHSDKLSTYDVISHYSFDLKHTVESPKLIEKSKNDVYNIYLETNRPTPSTATCTSLHSGRPIQNINIYGSGSGTSHKQTGCLLGISPIDRLNNSLDHWKYIGANKTIISIIPDGYKISCSLRIRSC